jgi:hypothetical protein
MSSANNIIQVTVYPTAYGVSTGLPGPVGPIGPEGLGFQPLGFTGNVVINYGSESSVIVNILSTENALTVGNTVKVSFPNLGSYLYGIITDYEANSLTFLQLSGTAIETNIATFGTIILNGLPGDAGSTGGISGPYVTTFNGLTGAVTGVTTGTANNFLAIQTFSAGISASGGTLAGIFNIPLSGITFTGRSLTGQVTSLNIDTINENINILSGAPQAKHTIKPTLLIQNDGQNIHGNTPLEVRGTTSQNSNLTNWTNVSGTVLSSIDLSGGFSGPTSSFSGLLTANAGISAFGGTFSNTVNLNSNTLYKPTLQYYNEPVSSPSISGNTLSLDLSLAQIFTVNLNSDIGTFTIQNTPTTANRGMGLTLILTADGTPRAITWGSLIKWPSAIPPTLTSTNNKKDILSFFTVDGGTSWIGSVAGQNY